jgi:hypothetical protein
MPLRQATLLGAREGCARPAAGSDRGMRQFAFLLPYRAADRDQLLRIDVSARDALEAVRSLWRAAEAVRPALGADARLSADGPLLLLAPLAAA